MSKSNNITRGHVIDAMGRFKNSERPLNFGEPKSWYVIHPQTKELFPLKGIFGLATGRSCSINKPDGFNTSEATRELKRLRFDVYDSRHAQSLRNFQEAIQAASKDTSENRLRRLKTAPKIPKAVLTAVYRYNRNQDVIAERLYIAQGICEDCNQPAPFRKKKDGQPFLEVHHTIPLADDGEDTLENTRALCPNCHRKAHHG